MDDNKRKELYEKVFLDNLRGDVMFKTIASTFVSFSSAMTSFYLLTTSAPWLLTASLLVSGATASRYLKRTRSKLENEYCTKKMNWYLKKIKNEKEVDIPVVNFSLYSYLFYFLLLIPVILLTVGISKIAFLGNFYKVFSILGVSSVYSLLSNSLNDDIVENRVTIDVIRELKKMYPELVIEDFSMDVENKKIDSKENTQDKTDIQEVSPKKISQRSIDTNEDNNKTDYFTIDDTSIDSKEDKPKTRKRKK